MSEPEARLYDRVYGLARPLATYHGQPGRGARLRRFYARFIRPGSLCYVEGMEHEVLAGLSVPLPALSFEFVPASPHAALASVARLEDLGRYGYDLALGEGFKLVYDRWVGTAELRAWLASRDPAGPFGDIYAVRLEKDRTPGR